MTDDNKFKNDKGKTEKRSYLCKKCNTIHHFLYHNKPSNTYQAHLTKYMILQKTYQVLFYLINSLKETGKTTILNHIKGVQNNNE